jgi:hypothetical protein
MPSRKTRSGESREELEGLIDDIDEEEWEIAP